ncbi:hypothetical protein [Pectobacterium polaris]|uniref:GAP1-N1 domain-containing protein n=1 Tax=Pectobacterium polaris TaxID=2042057 RepID=UPI00158430E2|nr:hypothetical protein [Pectobacterium polaris]
MKFDQCLFGYDDGHRLLASSIPLGDELSVLTELSDLAPGTLFGESGGYWTGLPVASLGRYVLMRTWPAPEMSRPGCVWTHALLIEPSLLEEIDDLSVLQSIVIRPEKLADRGKYRTKIETSLSDTASATATELQDVRMVSTLLSALYGSLTTSIDIQRPGELDAPLFAVWSQQWPRLRRNFRFQTAASRAMKTGGSVRFDAFALLVSSETYHARPDTYYPEWLSVAVKDAQLNSVGTLRTFLWHYGQDVRKQRGSFRPLAEIHLLDNEPQDAAERVQSLISRNFPDEHDALCLKQDLIDGVLVSGAQAELVMSALEDERQGRQIFPLPTASGVERLANLWPSQAEKILLLLQMTVDVQDGLGALIRPMLLNVSKTEDFWLLSHSQPALQGMMVKSDPAFLLSSERLLDDEWLTPLIAFIPTEVPGLDRFIDALLRRDNPKLVDAVYERFPVITASSVIARLLDEKENLSPQWKMSLIKRPDLLLQDAILGRVPRTHVLSEIAQQLGWFTPEVFNAGITPWFYALLHAENDIQGEEMEELGCFLLILACHSGREEGLRSVELFFNPIHRGLMDSTLSARATALLVPFLPDIGWFHNWDLGQRLRIIIAEAFIKHRWPPARYLTLARGKKGRTLLAKTIAEMPGGHAYIDATSD